jgi:hypothetical protein
MNQQNPKINIAIGERPWLAPDGQMLTDDQLRLVSRDWSPGIWNAFLAVTVEKPLKEVNENPWAYANALEELECTFWNFGDFDSGDKSLETLVRFKIRTHLTAQQRQILKHYFWDRMSERQVARRMGLAQQQVTTSKKNSLRKLKGLLESHVVAHRIGERSKQVFPPLEHPEMDLDICEVYREDLKGPMWCRAD